MNECSDKKRWEAFPALEPAERRATLAKAVAMTLKPRLAYSTVKNHEFEATVARLKADFTALIRPRADQLWKRVPRERTLKVAAAVFGEEWAERHAKLKGSALAEAVEAAFRGHRPVGGRGGRQRATEWTLPARAGQTRWPRSTRCSSRDAPRARGADLPPDHLRRVDEGRSPRARGADPYARSPTPRRQTLPARARGRRSRNRPARPHPDAPRARAGQTLGIGPAGSLRWDAPRARGADLDRQMRQTDPGAGTLPARAGQTPRLAGFLGSHPDAPRARGADWDAHIELPSDLGLPPRERGVLHR